MIIRMARPAPKLLNTARPGGGKVRKELWLDPEALRLARKILGTATEHETVEVTLDMIAFRQELLEGTRMLSGLEIDPLR